MHLYFLVSRANLAMDSFIGVLEHHDMSVIDTPVVAVSLGLVHCLATNLDWPFHLVEEG